MKNKKWEKYYNMYVSIFTCTKEKLYKMEEELFNRNREPNIEGITATKYYNFIKDILKVSFPLLNEKDAFEQAKLSWLYEYNEKVKEYNNLKELVLDQKICFGNIKQVNAFLSNGFYPGENQRAAMKKEYMSLCKEYPHLYSIDIFPF